MMKQCKAFRTVGERQVLLHNKVIIQAPAAISISILMCTNSSTGLMATQGNMGLSIIELQVLDRHTIDLHQPELSCTELSCTELSLDSQTWKLEVFKKVLQRVVGQ
jgi:hypothetical protein